MGFLDKIKDLFSDEEEVIETKEVEVEEREEHKLPTFMRKKIEEEEKKIEEVKEEPIRREVNRDSISDRDTLRSRTVNNNFSFPIEMDEPDYFETPRYGNQNVLVKRKKRKRLVYIQRKMNLSLKDLNLLLLYLQYMVFLIRIIQRMKLKFKMRVLMRYKEVLKRLILKQLEIRLLVV